MKPGKTVLELTKFADRRDLPFQPSPKLPRYVHASLPLGTRCCDDLQPESRGNVVIEFFLYFANYVDYEYAFES